MSSIPYQLAVRPDTGTNNGRLAIWLFLASEILFFGSLLSSYLLLRLGADVWPHGAERLHVPLGTINTLVLIASSVFVMLAFERSRDGDLAASRRHLMVTVGLGTAFLLIKAWEWNDKLTHGIRPADDLFYALYFTLTGVHVLHLAAGLLVLAHLAFWAPKIEAAQRGLYAHRVEIAGIYWHFVDLVWLVLFPLLYLT